jgi:hypothetical protein
VVAKATGTVKSVSENSVVITSDAGQESTITFANSSRIVKAAPGQTDLKNAAAIPVSEIQIGDRIFAKGQPGENGGLVASLAIVMKKTDIAQKQQTERDQWRRGTGGIVKSVDASSGTITLANSMAASGKPILVHVSPQTSILRYAPDSIKFDDARPGTLDQTKPGDQLLARGTKDSAGTDVTAQAIISGSFPYIAGTVISTDASKSRVTVMDLATKKPVVVRVSGDSMLRKLPPMAAARMAARLKVEARGNPDPEIRAEQAKAEQMPLPALRMRDLGAGAHNIAAHGKAALAVSLAAIGVAETAGFPTDAQPHALRFQFLT